MPEEATMDAVIGRVNRRMWGRPIFVAAATFSSQLHAVQSAEARWPYANIAGAESREVLWGSASGAIPLLTFL